jgi:hypothetical protein
VNLVGFAVDRIAGGELFLDVGAPAAARIVGNQSTLPLPAPAEQT